MEDLQLISFQIISAVGSARSMYIDAIYLAKEGKFKEARKQIEEGEKVFLKSHHAHAQLIQEEVNNKKVNLNLLLVHAEDQLMSAEAFKILANEFIDVYERISLK